MKLKYCVYVLLSQKDNKFYIGFTTNLKQRLTDHFRGNSDATSPRRPFQLIFCEYFLLKADALRREGYFKTNPGKKALKLMLRQSLRSGLTQCFLVKSMNGKLQSIKVLRIGTRRGVGDRRYRKEDILKLLKNLNTLS